MIDTLTSTIPISMFNRGLAGKIFEEVKKAGAKVVMKNNAPECVLLSPDEYTALIDAVNDAKLAAIAAERLAKFNPSKLISEEDHKKKYGITSEMLAGYEEVELE